MNYNQPGFLNNGFNNPPQWTPELINQWSADQALIYQNMPPDQVDWASLAKQWINMQNLVPQNYTPIYSNLIPNNIITHQTYNNIPICPQISNPSFDFNPIHSNPIHSNFLSFKPQINNLQTSFMPRNLNFINPNLRAPFLEPRTSRPIHTLTYQTNTNFNNSKPVQTNLNICNLEQKNSLDATKTNINQMMEHQNENKPIQEKSKNKLISLEIIDKNKNENGIQKNKKFLNINKMNDFETKTQNADEILDLNKQSDTNKKKQLPAWIKEGLEKMEKEKQKKIEQEQLIFKKKKEDQLRKELDSINDEDENEEDEEEEEKEVVGEKKGIFSNFTIQKSKDYFYLNEAEREKELMLRVRRCLTNILLEVTDSIIRQVASTCLCEFRIQKVSAITKQLANPAPIKKSSGLGGIVSVYASESESDEDEQKDKNQVEKNANINDDNELYNYEDKNCKNIKNEKNLFKSKFNDLLSKNKSAYKFRNRSRDRSRNRSKNRSRSKSSSRFNYKPKKSNDRSINKSKQTSRGRSREKSSGISIEQSRERSRNRFKDKFRNKSKERYRDKSRERSRNSSRDRCRNKKLENENRFREQTKKYSSKTNYSPRKSRSKEKSHRSHRSNSRTKSHSTITNNKK